MGGPPLTVQFHLRSEEGVDPTFGLNGVMAWSGSKPVPKRTRTRKSWFDCMLEGCTGVSLGKFQIWGTRGEDLGACAHLHTQDDSNNVKSNAL